MIDKIIKRLESLDIIASNDYNLKDYCEKEINLLLAANRLNFRACLISSEEYLENYDLISNLMLKHNLERRKIDV